MRIWAQIWIWFVDKEVLGFWLNLLSTLSGILLSRNHWTKWRSKTHWTEITCTLAHSVERKSGQRKGEWNTGGKGNEFLPRVSITKAKRSKGGMSERRHQLLNGKSSKQLLFQQIVSKITLSLMFRKASGINDLFCVGHVSKFFRGFCVSTQCVMRSTWWLWWKRKLIHTSLFLFNSTWHHTPRNFWWETNKIKVECPLLSTWLFLCFWWKVARTQQAY